MQALNETGWAGLLSLLAVFLLWFATVFRQRRAFSPALSGGSAEFPGLTAAAMAGVIALLTAAVMESPWQRADGWLLLWVWLALPISLDFDDSQETPAPRRWLAVPALCLAAAVSWFALQPVVASWHIERGIRLEFNNQYPEAAAAYRAALAHDRTQRVAHFNLTRTLAKNEQYADAWRASDEALRWDSAWELRLLRSRICQAQNHLGCAFSELKQELELYPYGAELLGEMQSLLVQIEAATQH